MTHSSAHSKYIHVIFNVHGECLATCQFAENNLRQGICIVNLWPMYVVSTRTSSLLITKLLAFSFSFSISNQDK